MKTSTYAGVASPSGSGEARADDSHPPTDRWDAKPVCGSTTTDDYTGQASAGDNPVAGKPYASEYPDPKPRGAPQRVSGPARGEVGTRSSKSGF